MLPEDVDVTVQGVRTAGGWLQVADIRPAHVTRTFLVTMGYAAWLDAFEVQRFRLLAQELGARLVVVETPGHGASGTHLNARERFALLARADFRPAAARMLDAALVVDPSLLTRPLAVLGYSLGTSIGTAVAALVRERTESSVTALVLVEPVAGRSWRPLELARATRAEDELVEDALADNDGISGSVEPWDRRAVPEPPRHDRLDLMLYANALRAGRLGHQVVATGTPRVVVVRGKDSRLSLPCAADDLIRRVRDAGRTVDELVMVGTHGLWHSLPSVRRLAQFVTAVTDRSA